ncbi:patatin-like phospholipase family protein [Flavivirga amylovorans]|uniref:Patatin-like phospholipase family protein n=1 Tax=Flavivirga amylovorans TaxID=870486 RepID=A0ABT8X2U7_9FLAO|nr:patatin-like phospholipase family protein [Flavivirga amylovorans]MDO5988182.1 patatin-like phospholipase family protein [Flavivirga amylovorans]
MKYVLAFISVFICFEGFSQDVKNDDVKVGLVLSGGGAKGLAHIGALKVIDSLGVKIDYVAGTSMGAIIGALYASGYSGNQLDSIFKEINFDNIINDNLPRGSKAFYERDNDEKYAIKLPFNGFKISLPSALSRGHNTYSLLSRLTLHVSEIKNFNELPIPFFCVATNIETGQAVILDKGNLAQSAMASGALPSIFQPVVINDQILTDGGVVNNYPIDELRAKGMDVIIGVDVQDGLAGREELISAPDVLLQINNFRTIKDMKVKIPKTDIYIKPDIENFNVVSFNEGFEIIEKGRLAAINKAEALQTLIKENQKKSITSKIKIEAQDSIIINKASFAGKDRYTRAYIMGKLKLKPNKKVSYEDFNKGVNSLVATNNFETFQYEFRKSKEKEGYDLFATIIETKNTAFIKAGVHYDDLYKSALLINLTKNNLLFDSDVASLDLILGDNVRYNFEYLIDKGFYWSIGLKSRYQQFHKNISAQLLLEDDQIVGTGLNKIDAELQDQTNQIYVQTLFRKDFALSLGAEHKRLEVKSQTIMSNDRDDEFLFENTDYLSVFGNLKLDTYDNKYFPKKGYYFNGDVHLYLHASRFNENFERFSIARADIGYAFSVSDKLAFNFQSNGGFKLGDKSTQALDFALGGYGNNLINNFVPFLGYDFLSITGNSYVKASAIADYEIFKNHHITLEGNWANVDDDIFETGEWFSFSDYNGYALGYSIDTFVGPIQGKFSYSPEQKKSIWFFNIGFWF